MKLGIVGAENSHTAAIAKLMNIEKAIRGFRVTHVWGETPVLAEAAASVGKIPNIVKKPDEMIGNVDCVMIDHRHGKYHVPVAMKFVNAGLPVFVDKPLSVSLREARQLLKLRKSKRVAVTSMSTLLHQQSAIKTREKLKTLGDLKSINLCGPGDYKSRYGGIFFYGIHQVNLMTDLFGTNPVCVRTVKNGSTCTAIVNYPNELTVTMNFSTTIHDFSVNIVGTEGAIQTVLVFDKSPYLQSTRLFTKMFQTGKEPYSDAELLAPIAVLDAIQTSLASNKSVKTAQV